MGRHIYFDLHMVQLHTSDILIHPEQYGSQFQEQYSQLKQSAYATYQSARKELEAYAEEHGGWEYLFDWTEDMQNGAIWSIALSKGDPMDKGLLDVVEDMRARGVIFGYTIYEAGA